MNAVVAEDGAPIWASVVTSADFDGSLAFYRDRIGLQIDGPYRVGGQALAALWPWPRDRDTRIALASHPGCPVAHLMLVDVGAMGGVAIRQRGDLQTFGLGNLNFYSRDLAAAAQELAALGFELWSQPVKHDFDDAVGSPTEIILEGPDHLSINLIQLNEAPPDTRIGQMRRYLAEIGYTETGYTGVVTSLMMCRDLPACIGFYSEVLGMAVLFEATLDQPEQNTFMRLPADAVSHSAFMQGGHMFGKMALTQLENVACDDADDRFVFPNIGYIAQIAVRPDIELAYAAARNLDARIIRPPGDIDLPLLGRCRAFTCWPSGGAGLVTVVERPAIAANSN